MSYKNAFLKALPLAILALFTVSIAGAAVQSHSIHDQIVVGSQNLVNNLNADLLDGNHGSHYKDPNPVDANCGDNQYLGGDGTCHNDQTDSGGTGGDGYLPDDPATSNIDLQGNNILNYGAIDAEASDNCCSYDVKDIDGDGAGDDWNVEDAVTARRIDAGTSSEVITLAYPGQGENTEITTAGAPLYLSGDGGIEAKSAVHLNGNFIEAEGGGICLDTCDNGNEFPNAGIFESSGGLGIYSSDEFVLYGGAIRDSGGELRLEASSQSGCTIDGSGNINCDGSKNFVQTVNGTYEVVYTSQESGEARTVWDESGILLEDGSGTIELPDHFSKVTDSAEPLVTQITPQGRPVAVAVTKESVDEITIETSSEEDVRVDVTVKGVRDGYADKQVVRQK